MTDPYVQVASVDGCWTTEVNLPPTDVRYIKSTLSLLAGQCPVSALAIDNPDGLVTQLILYRDPSRTRRTPTIPDCDEMADELAAVTAWGMVRGNPSTPQAPTLVALGLREGFDPTATEHSHSDVGRDVLSMTAGWRPCRLMSARQVDDDHIEWHNEPGIVLHAPLQLLPTIATAAHRLGQIRFTVTDYVEGRTYALRDETAAGSE